jgi:hypothetical protein
MTKQDLMEVGMFLVEGVSFFALAVTACFFLAVI